MTRAFTPHYGLVKPVFNQPTWGDDLGLDLDALDALIFDSLQVAAVVGLWSNGTDFTVGDRVIDAESAAIYTALISHTSAATGTFLADRTSYPTYWAPSTLLLTPRGEWAHDTHYNQNDIAYSTSEGVSAICSVTHTSNHAGTIRTDSVNWIFIVDISAGTVNADDVTYDNGTSGLVATDLQAAVDEAIVALNLKAAKASPTFTGVPLAPTAAVGTNTTQLATTAYVIAQIASLQLVFNVSVRAATTANITIATALNNGDTLDGLTLATSDRVLVRNQTLAKDNGIYVVGVSPARATDADTWAELTGIVVNVAAGTANAGLSYRSTINSGGTLNTDDITFVQFGSSVTLPLGISSGGSGQVTALAAFDAFKQVASATYVGVVEQATVAEIFDGTDAKFPDAEDMKNAGAYTALVDGATITVDLDTGINFKLDSIGGNRTLAFSNFSDKIGRSGYIRIKQDGTGSRTLDMTSSDIVNASGTNLALSTAAAAVDLIAYTVTDVGAVAKFFTSIAKAVA